MKVSMLDVHKDKEQILNEQTVACICVQDNGDETSTIYFCDRVDPEHSTFITIENSVLYMLEAGLANREE
jgi:peptide deformylase